jgi:hypothetical protein
MSSILSKIPKNMLQDSPEKQTTQLPSWFKHTAYLWIDNKITDREYYDSLDYLTKKISEENIVSSDEVSSDEVSSDEVSSDEVSSDEVSSDEDSKLNWFNKFMRK